MMTAENQLWKTRAWRNIFILELYDNELVTSPKMAAKAESPNDYYNKIMTVVWEWSVVYHHTNLHDKVSYV